jgi:hypothetical protein
MENPSWCFKLMNAASSRNTWCSVICSQRHGDIHVAVWWCVDFGFTGHDAVEQYIYWRETGRRNSHTWHFLSAPFSIILRIITLVFPIYTIHGNLDINGNKTYIVWFISFRWSSTTSLLCLFGKASLHLNRH